MNAPFSDDDSVKHQYNGDIDSVPSSREFMRRHSRRKSNHKKAINSDLDNINSNVGEDDSEIGKVNISIGYSIRANLKRP